MVGESTCFIFCGRESDAYASTQVRIPSFVAEARKVRSVVEHRPAWQHKCIALLSHEAERRYCTANSQSTRSPWERVVDITRTASNSGPGRTHNVAAAKTPGGPIPDVHHISSLCNHV